MDEKVKEIRQKIEWLHQHPLHNYGTREAIEHLEYLLSHISTLEAQVADLKDHLKGTVREWNESEARVICLKARIDELEDGIEKHKQSPFAGSNQADIELYRLLEKK